MITLRVIITALIGSLEGEGQYRKRYCTALTKRGGAIQSHIPKLSPAMDLTTLSQIVSKPPKCQSLAGTFTISVS